MLMVRGRKGADPSSPLYAVQGVDAPNQEVVEGLLHPSPAQSRMITPRAISDDPRLPLQRLHPDWTNNPRLHLGRCQRYLG